MKTPPTMKEIQKTIIRQNKNKYFDEAILLMKTTFFKYFFGVVSIFVMLCLFVFSLKTIFILLLGIIATIVAEVVILYKVLNLNIQPRKLAEDSNNSIKNEKDKTKIKDSSPTSKELQSIDFKKKFFPEKNELNEHAEENKPIVNIIEQKKEEFDEVEFENVLENADEDNGKDVKIKYKSLIKKSPDKKTGNISHNVIKELPNIKTSMRDLAFVNQVMMGKFLCYCD